MREKAGKILVSNIQNEYSGIKRIDFHYCQTLDKWKASYKIKKEPNE